jgi:ribose transport system permease protein
MMAFGSNNSSVSFINLSEIGARIKNISGMGTLIPLCIICFVITVFRPHFLTMSNLCNVLRQASIYAIMGVGMTFVIIAGGIDLSVGSVLALSTVVIGYTLNNGAGNMYLAMLLGVLTGALVGLINGVIISFINIPPFIVTLGTMNIARGVTLLITNAAQVPADYEPFRVLGTGYWLGIPIPVYLFIIIGMIGAFILSNTATGRYVFALGSNEEAARLSGVKIIWNKIKIYTICGITVGLAAVIYLSRLGAAQPTAGNGYELQAIAAVVIGGTSMTGGEGGMLGTLLGAIIVAVINNGLVLLNVATYYQWVVLGAIIVIAVGLDITLKNMAAKRDEKIVK